MKKNITIAALGLALVASIGLAIAAGSDPLQFARDPTDVSEVKYQLNQPAGSTNGMMAFNGTTKLVEVWPMSSSLTFTGGTITVTPAVGDVTGLTAALAGKFSNPAGNATQCIRGDGSITACPGGSGTVTSITAGTGLSGGTITSTGTISMTSTGTAGTYSGVTTDAQGRVTAGTTLSINDAPGRSLVTTTASTGYQVSSTRNARVCYEGTVSTTSTIGGPASASVFIETADTNSTTPGDWTTKAVQTYTNTITLAVVLNQVQANNWSLCRDIPAGKFVRVRSGSISGTASAAINTQQQETLL